MKISELIKMLNICEHHFGDIDIYKGQSATDVPLTRNNFSYDAHKERILINI